MANIQTPQKLFAAYVQAEKDGRRRQYIVFPPHTGEVNGFRLAEDKSSALIMTRKQDSPAHRATWQREVAPAIDESYAQTLSSWVSRSTEAGWNVSPLIVIEMHPTEYRDVLSAEKEAHHRLLERFKRVASRKYGFII